MVASLFNILFFLIPLIFLKNTSELFEFNKIITLYVFTTTIIAAWVIKSISQRKFIFRRTILDVPLVAYLSIYFISTLLSIDPRTSWLGYYSRFNGGLVSQICFTLLYWAFVSNINKNQITKILKFGILGVVIAATIGFFEHFSIFPTCPAITYDRLKLPINTQVAQEFKDFSTNNKIKFLFKTKCWEQDLQERVFSTLGQPNWLAAIIVVFLPFTWIYIIKANDIKKNKNQLINAGIKLSYLLASLLLFTVLMFTKSRSGLVAFVAISSVFWVMVYYVKKLKYLKEFILLNSSFLIILLIVGSPFRVPKIQPTLVTTGSPALETGGTESVGIRKIVWRGAFEIFKHYPILGTGPETFAFAYPLFKPQEHNLTSEWDFIYNKAHNEFLNYLATTGVLGFLSYSTLIAFSLFLIVKNFKISKDAASSFIHLKKHSVDIRRDLDWKLQAAIFAGYISILITNFSGFSVVTTSLLFFLFPAFSFIATTSKDIHLDKTRLKLFERILILSVLLISSFVIYKIIIYFLADTHYNSSTLEYRSGNYQEAEKQIDLAIKFSPDESLYLNQLAVIKAQTVQDEKSADEALSFSERSIALSPYNLNFKRTYAVLLTRMSQYNKNFLLEAISVLEKATKIAPTDAKLYYQLGLAYLKTGQNDLGISALAKSIELKPNYKEGRFALGTTFRALKEKEKAKEQFSYILLYIDPKDELTKKYLDELN